MTPTLTLGINDNRKKSPPLRLFVSSTTAHPTLGSLPVVHHSHAPFFSLTRVRQHVMSVILLIFQDKRVTTHKRM